MSGETAGSWAALFFDTPRDLCLCQWPDIPHEDFAATMVAAVDGGRHPRSLAVRRCHCGIREQIYEHLVSEELAARSEAETVTGPFKQASMQMAINRVAKRFIGRASESCRELRGRHALDEAKAEDHRIGAKERLVWSFAALDLL